MKTKRNIIALFTLCTALSITGCAGQETLKTENRRILLYPPANHLPMTPMQRLMIYISRKTRSFADHKDVWDKVFGMMNKSTADPDGNYADYLADTVEANKTSFTDSELKLLPMILRPFVKSKNRSLKLKAKCCIRYFGAKNDSDDTAFPEFLRKRF